MIWDICIFGSELAPSSDGVYIGGSATSAVRLSKSLSEIGERVHIVSMAPRDWNSERIHRYEGPDWASTHIFDAAAQHPGVFDGLHLLYSGTKALINYCKENNIDVIHSHSGYSVLATIPAIAGRYLDIPTIHTQYCPIPTDPIGIEEFLSSSLSARFTLNQVDHVLAMTDNINQSLEENGIHHTSFVPPAIDTDEYRPDLSVPTSVSIADEKLSILFVGSLKIDKGVEYLIKGAGEAKDEGIPLQLILTTERDFPGSEKRRQHIDKLIDEYDLEENIVELGIIDDMPNVIAHADVLVAPFTTTSGPSDYPLAILEAMACETPVIASRVGGIPELLSNHRGYLIPPEDSKALGEAIRDAKEGLELAQNRKFIQERFAPKAIAQDVIDVYGEYV